MSDYYYFDDREEEFGFSPVLGEDYIKALHSIAKKHGLKISDRMVLEELGYKTPKKPKNAETKKSLIYKNQEKSIK